MNVEVDCFCPHGCGERITKRFFKHLPAPGFVIYELQTEAMHLCPDLPEGACG